MLSHTKTNPGETLTKTVLLLLAVTLGGFELFVPRIPFFPWMKPGLANCVTVVWIVRYGGRSAVLFTLMRSWITGFFFGFSFFSLMLGTTGGIASAIAMGIAWKILGKHKIMGLIGISVLGALFHNIAQIILVYFLLAQNRALFFQLPLMALASLIFGTITGLLALVVYRVDPQINKSFLGELQPRAGNVNRLHFALSIVSLGFCFSLVAVDRLTLLAFFALATTFLVQLVNGWKPHLLMRPAARFWPLFFTIFVFHGIFTYGRSLASLPWITIEGLQEGFRQSLRLWTWLQFTGIFSRIHFHKAFFALLRKFFPAHPETLWAGLLSVEHFPLVPTLLARHAPSGLSQLLRHPVKTISSSVESITKELTMCIAESPEPAPDTAEIK